MAVVIHAEQLASMARVFGTPRPTRWPQAVGMGNVRRAKVFLFEPVGIDLWDRRVKIARGATVVKTQPPGCPRNGTMGHCFVADAETGAFLGLVLVASLQTISASRSEDAGAVQVSRERIRGDFT